MRQIIPWVNNMTAERVISYVTSKLTVQQIVCISLDYGVLETYHTTKFDRKRTRH